MVLDLKGLQHGLSNCRVAMYPAVCTERPSWSGYTSRTFQLDAKGSLCHELYLIRTARKPQLSATDHFYGGVAATLPCATNPMAMNTLILQQKRVRPHHLPKRSTAIGLVGARFPALPNMTH